MNTQDKKELSPVETFVSNCLAYSGNAVRIAALKEEQAGLVSANGELRKAIVPFFKEHKDDKWSSLGKSIKAAIVAAGVKDVDGLLGVLKTSFEYGILPTEQNADRLRKRETWVSWNGAVVPNSYGKVHKPKEESATPQTVPAPISQKIEAMQANVDAVFGTASPTIPAHTITQPQTPPKVPSTKPVTAQKTQESVHPISSNVSSSDEPISPREHFGILFAQMLKNETFRTEYTEILAMMLDVDKATLTRCMVQARDEIK